MSDTTSKESNVKLQEWPYLLVSKQRNLIWQIITDFDRFSVPRDGILWEGVALILLNEWLTSHS